MGGRPVPPDSSISSQSRVWSSRQELCLLDQEDVDVRLLLHQDHKIHERSRQSIDIPLYNLETIPVHHLRTPCGNRVHIGLVRRSLTAQPLLVPLPTSKRMPTQARALFMMLRKVTVAY